MQNFFNKVLLQLEFFLKEYSEKLLLSISVLLLSVFLGWLFSRTLNKIGKNKTIKSNRVYRLIAGSINTTIIGIGAICALGTLGVNITVLVTGLGLTGFGLGLALKDAISNLVSGIMILLYSPFDLNDIINVAGVNGKVVDINLRYVTVLTETETVLIPNGSFMSSIIKKTRNHNS